jgi:voltage-gated potassium channel
VNKSIIEKVPFFRGASEDLLSAMMSRLESRVLLPGEVIFKIDDPGEEIYFIQAGDVEIKDQSQNPVATLSDGSFFGEMALISERPRSATAVAKNFCEVYTLSRKDFESLAQDYPSVRSHIEQIMSERQVDRDS